MVGMNFLMMALMLQAAPPRAEERTATHCAWYCPKRTRLWVRQNADGDLAVRKGASAFSPYSWYPAFNGWPVEAGTAAVCVKAGEDPNKKAAK